MPEKKEKWIRAGLVLIALGAMLLFFETAHPLVILDADDWTYISASRIAVPASKFWNPARILPETLMPYASSLAVMLFSAIGYLQSITLMNGIVLSLFITGYVCEFYLLLNRKLRIDATASSVLSLLFLLLHFLIFRTGPSGNNYLFRANDVSCIYYYVIPAILNCSLVMRLLRTGENRSFLEKGMEFRKGMLAVAVYFAIFSNLFESVILAAFCGVDLLNALSGWKKRRQTDRGFLREQSFNLAVIALWLGSLAFEGSGERAGSPETLPYGEALADCLRRLPTLFLGMNRILLLLAGGFLAVAAALWLLKKIPPEDREEIRRVLLPVLFTAGLVTLFEVLLCAKVRTDYIQRSDVMFGTCFALLAVVSILPGIIGKWDRRAFRVLPLLLIILFSEVDTGGRTFLECNDILATAETCTMLNQEMIDQIVAAERNGERETDVLVFVSGADDNWPHASYMGPRVAASLYKHGITEHLMEVRIIPDRSVNEKLHVLEKP